MHTLLYDGSFEGFLSAVFDVYYYKFDAPHIVRKNHDNGNIFEKTHIVHSNQKHSNRVWTGLQKKISPDTVQQVYKTFLSGEPGIETILLQYLQYAFKASFSVETDFSNAAVLKVFQTAKKVHREKHRMEAFVRFQETADGLYYAMIEPDFDVLPLITRHFKDRYADQRWMIWDHKRRYGIYYDLTKVSMVEVAFDAITNTGKDVSHTYSVTERLYQQLWQHYFKNATIAARKNTRLHIQHMPVRYWKFLPEKQPLP